MFPGPVPFMAVEPIDRKDLVEAPHHPVPDHLRHDGGAGDVQTPGIPSDNGQGRHRKASRNPDSIHQGQGGPDRQMVQGPDHRQAGGGLDADPVDLLRNDKSDPDIGVG